MTIVAPLFPDLDPFPQKQDTHHNLPNPGLEGQIYDELMTSAEINLFLSQFNVVIFLSTLGNVFDIACEGEINSFRSRDTMDLGRKIPSQMLVIVLIFSALVSCTLSRSKEEADSLPIEMNIPLETQPTSMSPAITESTDDEEPNLQTQGRLETEESAYTQPTRSLTRTPLPSSTQTSEPDCKPFPDAIYDILWDSLFVRCGTEATSLPLPDPLNDWLAFFWDYTPRTGRIAYGDEKRTLWVYDFWTGSNQQWLDEEVITAQWSPLSSSESGSQQLAIPQADGELKLITHPSQTTAIAMIGDASHLSWSPDGETIAYIKDQALYIIDIDGGQPRKLEEGVSGTPVWELEHEAIIVSAAPLRIVKLDGSGSFTPTRPDGTLPSDRPAEIIL
ncbi:MAG: hypothetical protein A2Z14_17695 [Chloroflexi bacterium RBG_16_48_8]|nr:MAG: hypothetical protein A2Z14_17695 [Chloroflexi bacterium RBG_16_48_8]